MKPIESVDQEAVSRAQIFGVLRRATPDVEHGARVGMNAMHEGRDACRLGRIVFECAIDGVIELS